MDFTCVELEAFTRELLRVADEEVLREFQLALAVRPEAGDLIRHALEECGVFRPRLTVDHPR